MADVAADAVEISDAAAAAIVGLLPLVLALADTVGGARCLVSMLAAGRGVGDAAQAAILRQPLPVDGEAATAAATAAAEGEGTAVGVLAVVRMLVSFFYCVVCTRRGLSMRYILLYTICNAGRVA